MWMGMHSIERMYTQTAIPVKIGYPFTVSRKSSIDWKGWMVLNLFHTFLHELQTPFTLISAWIHSCFDKTLQHAELKWVHKTD